MCPQNMDALEMANETRRLRGNLKQDMKTGKVKISELLLNSPDYISTMTIYNLLIRVPFCGPKTTRQILKRCYISEGKMVRDLTLRQCIEINTLLPKDRFPPKE